MTSAVTSSTLDRGVGCAETEGGPKDHRRADETIYLRQHSVRAIRTSQPHISLCTRGALVKLGAQFQNGSLQENHK